MSASRVRVLFLLIVGILSVATGAANAQTMTGVESRITTAIGDQYDPAISGNVVVFTDFRTSDTDVYYTDLSTTLEDVAIVAPGNQELTGVSNGRIVYTDYRSADVVLFNTADGTTTNLTAADKPAGVYFNAVDPAISGSLVAWQDSRDGNMEIYAKDVVTGEERRITDSTAIDAKPAVSGTVIVWQRCFAGGTCDIWAYDWSTETTTQITNTPTSNERNPNIDGQKIVYQTDESGTSDIGLYDLGTGTERHLSLAGTQANPHVSGDNVSFDDLSAGLYHIGLWNLPTGQVFQVTSGPSGQYLNDIDGNRIVYTDDRHGDLEIYMYEFEIETPVDTEPPVFSEPFYITLNATSPSGAMLPPHAVTVTDNMDPSPTFSCTLPLDEPFIIGYTKIICGAADASGNVAYATFTVHVLGAEYQLPALADLVGSLNVKRGIKNSLEAKLDAALAALEGGRAGSACNQLNAFINEVNAQTGKAITPADAAALIAAATQIQAALGCY